ncbi:MAG: hypothetical protein FWG42_12590 [Clostridiales bacterium]|nr:hypothetical protein [Clostridiales bacterium]
MGEIMDNIARALALTGGGGVSWPAVFLCILTLLLLTWLLLRRLKLWYWKVNVQVDVLKNIDQKLHTLEEGLKEAAVSIGKPEVLPTEDEAAAHAGEGEEQEPTQQEVSFCIGKTGIVYTEEELDELIKD